MGELYNEYFGVEASLQILGIDLIIKKTEPSHICVFPLGTCAKREAVFTPGLLFPSAPGLTGVQLIMGQKQRILAMKKW